MSVGNLGDQMHFTIGTRPRIRDPDGTSLGMPCSRSREVANWVRARRLALDASASRATTNDRGIL